jgi:hypothetical protein
MTDTGRPFYDLAARVGRNARNIRAADKRELLARLHSAEEVNPAPYYSYNMSACARVAVYKAHCACEIVPRFDALYFAEREWRNLSYATEAGIVFG